MARIVAALSLILLLLIGFVLGGAPATTYTCVGGARLCSNVSAFLANAHTTQTVAALNGAYATSAQSTRAVHAEFVGSAGRFTYDPTSALSTDATLFDMASCSKIMATTTAVAQLYQAGHLGLDDLVTSQELLGSQFASNGKGEIRIRNLMLHNAGFPPDPNPGYSSPVFGCPQTANFHPGQDFSCEQRILNDLIQNQGIVYPTGSQFIYSDLSMITAMFVVGRVVQNKQLVTADKFPSVCFGREYTSLICNFYAYVDNFIFKRYGLGNTSYIPTSPLNTPPAWVSEGYHHGLIMGYVSDQNAYALGGISGHAGVFSNVGDALRFMKVWMNAEDPAMLNSTTIALFTKVANLTQSSRALGWDTNDQPEPPCGNLSKATYFHIGFTGTQFCGDPTNNIMTVLLGNGRYPDFNVDGTIILRPEFNSLVLELLTAP